MEKSGTDRAAAPLSETGGEPASADGPSGLYGRRRGKRLTQRHALLMRTVLPAIAVDPSNPIDPATLFGAARASLWLEIGFGGGEHLAACAAQDPGAGFIGCEPFRNGVAKAAALIEEGRLQNVRLYEGDASAVIAALPARALDGVYLLYPDPWPKRRQRKRRFLGDAMLLRLARVMRPGAQLRFATDIDDNGGWTLARILRSPHFVWAPASARDWREPWAGWGSTRYEAKALSEGRTPVYLTFKRTDALAPAEPPPESENPSRPSFGAQSG